MEFLTPKNFLILQAVLIGIGAIYLKRRVPREGIRLKFGRSSQERVTTNSMDVKERIKETYRPRGTSQGDETQRSVNDAPPSERTLNVHFNFNGHSWDAYEVFGLPAGSSLDKVREAFSKSTASASDASKEFYSLALQAIEQHRQKR